MKDKIIGGVFSSLTIFFTAVQTEQLFQIISLIFAIFSSLILSVYYLILIIQKAKRGEKIELEDVNKVVGNAKDIVKEIDKAKENLK